MRNHARAPFPQTPRHRTITATGEKELGGEAFLEAHAEELGGFAKSLSGEGGGINSGWDVPVGGR